MLARPVLARDESLLDADSLPDPDEIAEEIVEDLRSALEQVEEILEDLRNPWLASTPDRVGLGTGGSAGERVD